MDTTVEPPIDRSSLVTTLRALERIPRRLRDSGTEPRRAPRVHRALLNNLDGMAYCGRLDLQRTMDFVSAGCTELTGYAAGQLARNRQISFQEIIHPQDRARAHEELRVAVGKRQRYAIDYRIVCRDGAVKWVAERGVAVIDRRGQLVRLEGLIADITERKLAMLALEQAERGFRSIFEHAVEGIFQTAPNGDYLNINPALARIYGYDEPAQMIAEIGNIQDNAYAEPGQRAEFLRELRAHGSVSGFVSQVRRRDGATIWISENARTIRDAGGSVLFYEGTVEDITDSKLNQEKLEYQASHDAVTGLPNRLLMNDRLKRMMLSAQRNDSVVGVVLIDLDHFKLINDTFGHNCGDVLLQTVARRMQECLRESDTVARLGGDEFVLLLSGEGRGEALSQVAQRVLKAISQPWYAEEHEFCVSCSMGVSIFPRDGRDVQTLLRNADTAMYKAKDLGRNNFQFYSSEMNAIMSARLEMQTLLRKAVANQQFVLLYQPMVDLASGRVDGMEALLRIADDKGALLSPQRFIALAEESGLILPIGEWVMREACSFNKSLQDRGLPPIRVAINLSARQLTRYDLMRAIERALRETELPPHCLELELTESMVMHDPEGVIVTLRQLEALGVHISIDDFGTGYSSLSYLKRFPVSTLKIDQSFMRNLGEDKDGCSLVKAIISLGHSLDMRVIAEGVETMDQMSLLMQNRCDAMQGYLYSHPLSGDDFFTLLKHESAAQSTANELLKRCAPRCPPDYFALQ
jgi:diguanylate cyclase (GGDEF)-like protein/PAS domain S-box-containing protein